ncbi:MAG: hypothetical protein U9Q17_02315, partial [Chloroflexota bacterium]|nr:hypothetical protein [Chloroflexota bacterium]
MKHILGMAEPNLDLVGVTAIELELDYLRLAYAVKEIRNRGDKAQGYFVVLSPDIRDRVRLWEVRYETGDCVNVIYASLLVSEMQKLTEERERSEESPGQQIAVNALRRKIFEMEPSVREITQEEEF